MGSEITIYDKVIKVSSREAAILQSFLEWVEGTSLFHAIKNDASGTDIIAQDGSLQLSLNKNVQHADELPPQVLLEFYVNSPYFQNPVYSPIKTLLTNG